MAMIATLKQQGFVPNPATTPISNGEQRLLATPAVMTKSRRVNMPMIVPTKLQPAVLKEVELTISQLLTPLSNLPYWLAEIL
jgi:hypothetical protein